MNCGCKFSTCTCLRQDEILSPRGGRDGIGRRSWSQSFVAAIFQRAESDTMEILSPRGGRREGNFELWVQVFNLHMPSARRSLVATKRHDEIVSPRGTSRTSNPASFFTRLPRQFSFTVRSETGPQITLFCSRPLGSPTEENVLGRKSLFDPGGSCAHQVPHGAESAGKSG